MAVCAASTGCARQSLAVDIVTADGQVRTASATENEDLFWAVRGAGSNFGVVTNFEFRLHPVGPVVALCAPAYALEDGPTVRPGLARLHGLGAGRGQLAPVLWSVPADEHFPRKLRGGRSSIPSPSTSVRSRRASGSCSRYASWGRRCSI